MKKTLASVLAIALVLACGVASASYQPPKVWDDLSWWGNSGATPEPVKDCTRSGYWWWPTEPKSNAGDTELWGNRGVVYAQWEKPEIKSDPPPPPPPVDDPGEKRKIPVLNSILFDFDKSVVKPEGKAVVDQAAGFMKGHNDTVVVEGHTCNVGADDYNMALGQRRADAVKASLVAAGVPAANASAKSLGETKPAKPNDTPANRKLNRRAVLVIEMKD